MIIFSLMMLAMTQETNIDKEASPIPETWTIEYPYVIAPYVDESYGCFLIKFIVEESSTYGILEL